MRDAPLYAALLLSVALPMLALAFPGIWFADAQRLIAREAEQRQQQDIAQVLARNVLQSIEAQVMQRSDAALLAWAAGGAQQLRTRYLADPAIDMVVLFSRDGTQVFPGPQETSLFAENRRIRQAEQRLEDLRSMAADGLVWSGSLTEPGSPAIACRRVEAGVICLMLHLSSLQHWAGAAAQPAKLADLNLLPPAAPEMAQALATMPAPLTGFAIVTEYRPAPGRGPLASALLLAPTVLASVIAAVFGMRAHQARIRAAQQRIDMLSGLSHDLRTPLANLRLYARLLRKPGLPSERQTRYLDVIEHETSQLSDRVDQVLTAATRQSQPDLRHVSPDRLVLDLVERYRPAFASTSPPVLDLHSPGPALFDAAAFERVLLNLLDNARKHAPGAIPRVATEADSGFIRLTVSDAGGVGVAADVSGFGLGLRTCHNLAQRAGGGFDAAISPHGSSFRLALPIHAVGA